MDAVIRRAAALAGLCAGCGVPTVTLSEAQNYAYTSALTAPCQTIGAGSDPTLSWDGLDVGLLGDPVDPTAIDALRFASFDDLSREEVLSGIDRGVLSQRDVTSYADLSPSGRTSASLSAFTALGVPLDPARLVPGGTYLVDAERRPPEGGAIYLTFTFLCPDEASDATAVVLDRDTASLAIDVDLGAMEPVEIPAADARIDWSAITRGGNGAAIVPYAIDRLSAVRFEGDVEADLLRADPAERFTADVGGWTSWRLSDLEDEGASFPGFDGDGWWLALECTTCLNPAPVFFGRVG